MSRQSVVTVTWTCDVCGTGEPEVDGYSPHGWQQIVTALVTAQLGNVAAKHLCADCGDSLWLLLDHRLGDTGDMAQAWSEGFTRALAGDGSNANPYATEADQ